MKTHRTGAQFLPLTMAGTLVLALALGISLFSVTGKNIPGMVSALCLAATVGAAILLTRIDTDDSAEQLPAAFALKGSAIQTVTADGEPVTLVCPPAAAGIARRYHLELSGRISSGERTVYRVQLDIRLRGNQETLHEIFLPSSGMLHLAGYLSVRDMFGLGRFRKTRIQFSSPVRPYSGYRFGHLTREIKPGSREGAARLSGDMERILVRDYAPGDLARDINWKALERTGSLLTRIPPESPREIPLVTIAVVLPPATLPAALIHLDHIRSLAASSITDIREQFPEYGCLLIVQNKRITIESTDDPGRALDMLAESGFAPGEPLLDGELGAGDRLIGAADDPVFKSTASRYAGPECLLLASRLLPPVTRPQTAETTVPIHRLPLVSAFPVIMPADILASTLDTLQGGNAEQSDPEENRICVRHTGVYL